LLSFVKFIFHLESVDFIEVFKARKNKLE